MFFKIIKFLYFFYPPLTTGIKGDFKGDRGGFINENPS